MTRQGFRIENRTLKLMTTVIIIITWSNIILLLIIRMRVEPSILNIFDNAFPFDQFRFSFDIIIR